MRSSVNKIAKEICLKRFFYAFILDENIYCKTTNFYLLFLYSSMNYLKTWFVLSLVFASIFLLTGCQAPAPQEANEQQDKEVVVQADTEEANEQDEVNEEENGDEIQENDTEQNNDTQEDEDSDIKEQIKQRNEARDSESADAVVVDVANSTLAWESYKVIGSSHNGTVDIKSASVQRDEAGNLVSATAIIDMPTLESELGDNLDGHLKNEDFFAVETFPEARIDVTSFAYTDEDITATADLTIKGITHEITFPVEEKEGKTMASFTIDRTKWDITYGSNNFFDNLGDKAIKDDIEFDVTLAYSA